MREEIHDTEYEGAFTELYDLLHPTACETAAYERLAKERGGCLLELGSGTGRLVLPLARAGVEVWGLDLYPDMLDVCRRKLEAEDEAVRERVTLVEGDARRCSLPRTFPLVTAPCNFLDSLLGAEDLHRAFACAARHLDKDGLLVLDSSAPDLPAMVKADGETQVGEFEVAGDGRRLVSRFTPRFDFLRQIETDEILLEEIVDGTVVSRARTTMTVTWHHPRELESALLAAGLEPLGTYGSVDRKPMRACGGDVVVFARRARP